jgi:penicillin G amidase
VSRTGRLIIGIVGSLIILLCAVFFILRSLVTKSFPQTTGTVSVAGIHAPTDVWRDGYGVPHILANNEHDLMFAAGYVQAQDRLWQMDLLRRTGEGRLSEIFGSAGLNYDRLFRTVGLDSTSYRIARHLHPDALRTLEDYCDGVNAFIDDHRGRYPMEFDMLNYEPEPWTVENSVLVSRLIAWNLNLAWYTDITYGEIAAKVPPEKLQQILPSYPDSVKPIVPAMALRPGALGDMLKIGMDYRAAFGLGSLEAGSNGWVADSAHSLSGKPLLANDPHLPVPQPSFWYEIHYAAPGWNVAGVALPGVPFIIIGHTGQLGWGFTNAMIDDADFYTEKIDTATPGHYIYDGVSRPFNVRIEKIAIKSADTIAFAVRSTVHGPVVSDIHPASVRGEDSAAMHTGAVSMKWTGYEPSDEIYGFYLLNRSTNITEFEHAITELTVPGQAAVYADTAGNIAMWTAARVPIRGRGNPMLPLPGWTNETDWKGFVPFDKLPKSLNPPEGFIVCANQRIADKNYPYYLSSLWEPPSRSQRIRELLRSAGKFTADDFKQFQQDVMSPYAREIVPHLFAAWDSIHTPDPTVSDALTYLHNWDYRFSTTDIATSIFNSVFVHLLRDTYADEMGDTLFNQFVFFGAIPYRVTAQILADDSSSWFDDIRTPQVESRDDIIRKSFTEAMGELKSALGEEMKRWQWGSLHTATFRHPFGERKALSNVFNVGSFPAPGGGTTVNKTEFRLSSPYEVTVGASVRQVIDLALPLSASMVLTTGESGQPFQAHYSDQTTLWLNGGYHRVTIDWNEIAAEHYEHLQLRPR